MIERWIFLRDGTLTARTKLVLAALYVAMLIALLPLRLVLGWAHPGPRTFSASAVEGSAWAGRIGDLRLGALPIGNVDAGIRPLPLLMGRPELSMNRPALGADPAFSAIVGGGEGSVVLRDVQGQVALRDALGALPAAALGFRDFHMAMSGGRCESAGGQLTLFLSPLSDLMTGQVALTGSARCDKGALYIPMTGPTGLEKLFLRLEPDGRWRSDLILSGLPVEVSTPLLEMGFTGRPGGIGITSRGKL